MIESIEFTNFKALRKTTLPLSPFTLLLGPNGSGKTTVLQALQRIASLANESDDGRGNLARRQGVWPSLRSMTADDPTAPIEVKLHLRLKNQLTLVTFRWHEDGAISRLFDQKSRSAVPAAESTAVLHWLSRVQTYALDASQIGQPVPVHAGPLQWNGSGLAALLDDLRAPNTT